MDLPISLVNFNKYKDLSYFVNELKTFVKQNHKQINEEFTEIAPLFNLSIDEYNLILNRIFYLEDEQLYLIKIAWNKSQKKGLFKALEFAYVWQLKGGHEFLKRLKYIYKKL